MQSNLAMDLRRIALENDTARAQQAATAAAKPAPGPRMTEMQRIFKRLQSAGAPR